MHAIIIDQSAEERKERKIVANSKSFFTELAIYVIAYYLIR